MFTGFQSCFCCQLVFHSWFLLTVGSKIDFIYALWWLTTVSIHGFCGVVIQFVTDFVMVCFVV